MFIYIYASLIYGLKVVFLFGVCVGMMIVSVETHRKINLKSIYYKSKDAMWRLNTTSRQI